MKTQLKLKMPSIQANTTATNYRSTTLWVGFSIVFALSLVFEVIENSRSIIDKYRDFSGNSLGNIELGYF